MKYSETIENLYAEEAEQGREEFETIQFCFPISAHHKFLLESLADRFRLSQAKVARPIFEDALELAFLSLKPNDQDTVASAADKKATDYLVKTYKERGGSYEHHGLGHWGAWAYSAQHKGEQGEGV